MFAPITTHVQDAVARLITQYKNSPNIIGVITVFAQQIQVIENALINMNILRYLNGASGVQLDNIGSIVGIARTTGQTDAQYINDIFAQIKINTSDGQPEQVIQTFQLFTGTAQVRLFEFFPGEVLIESEYYPPDIPTVNSLFAILDEVLAAGVAAVGVVCYDSVAPFAYRVSDSPGVGYGTNKDPLVGGAYAS